MPPYSKQLPPHLAAIEQSQQSIRDYIESIWCTVRASHDVIADAREAMGRAEKTLARRLSERR